MGFMGHLVRGDTVGLIGRYYTEDFMEQYYRTILYRKFAMKVSATHARHTDDNPVHVIINRLQQSAGGSCLEGRVTGHDSVGHNYNEAFF